MRCQFLYLLCTISLFIPNVFSSGVINDCFFIGNSSDAVELVCDAAKGSYPTDNCFTSFSNHRVSVKHLKTGLCTSPTLRRRFFESFMNLRTIDLSHFGAEILSDLQLKYLQSFNASHNKLTMIKASNFRYTPAIRELDLANNKISYVEYGSFSRLRELKTLNLNFNVIEKIEHDLFKYNKKLKILQLKNNPIKRLDSNIFMLLKRSVSVNVSCDNVREIDTSSVGTALRIEFNRNCEMFFRALYGETGLKCVGNVFQNLTHLNVSSNHLENAPQIVELLGPSIETLDLASNAMGNECLAEENRCFQRFQQFTNLQVLNLSRTNLTYFSIKSIRQMNKLTVLNLSFNQLQTLEFGSMVFRDLKTLKLDGNRLVDGLIVDPMNLPKLSFLSISENQFSCEHLTKIMEKWPNSTNLSRQRDAIDCKNNSKQSTKHSDHVLEMENGRSESERRGNNVRGKGNGDDKLNQQNETMKINKLTEIIKTTGVTEVAETFDMTKTTEITEKTNEMLKTTDATFKIENDRATKIMHTIESTESSTMNTKNTETTTDISDKNEGDFTTHEVHITFISTKIITTDSSTLAADLKLHTNFETTKKLVISDMASRSDFSKSFFASKYARIRKSLNRASSAQTISIFFVSLLVICIGYLIVRLSCTRRFKRNLIGRSRRMHVPYKLDQRDDGRNNVELINHLDFRQWQLHANDNAEQCEFD